jgi:tetratricopeptide (TPR) repeat protein
MRPEVLDAHTQLLSVPPVFDESTALDVARSYADGLADGAGEVADAALRELRLAGLVVRERDAWRVADPLRAECRRRLFLENGELFRAVAGRFVDHAHQGFSQSLTRILGREGARVNLSILNLFAHPEDTAYFDEVVEIIDQSARAGRHSDTDAAAHLLGALPLSSTDVRHRQIAFLWGLSAWRQRKREDAVSFFEQVLVSYTRDRADAIAAHLLGVVRHSEGNTEAAIPLLERSVADLRDAGDRRGLCLTLTSLGRVLRDRAEQSRYRSPIPNEITLPELSEENLSATKRPVEFDLDLEAAISALEEACRISSELEDDRLAARALIELALSYDLVGLTDLAIQAAEQSVQLLHTDSENAIWARTVLGSLYRDAGTMQRAALVLEDGAAIAERLDTGSLELAKLLNVLASTDRRTGDYADAVRHARESVQIGRRLRSRRHLSQALHTLAAALIDMAGDQRLREADESLGESEKMLRELGDARGLAMVANTRLRLTQAISDK